MPNPTQTLMTLEQKFWQSMVDQDAQVATEMLCEPALMVSGHGNFKFDHATYRKMADQGPVVLKSFELSEMDVVFPTPSIGIVTYKVKQRVANKDGGDASVQEMNDSSTWIKSGERWLCAAHTETPRETATAH